MLRMNYCLLFFLLIAVTCSGQSNWKSYTDEKGQFKIEFRGDPKVETVTEEFNPVNITWTVASTNKADGQNLSYLVKYADFPAEIITSDSMRLLLEFFVFVQKDLLSTLGDAGIENLNIKQIQKYPGREFRWIDRPNKLAYTRRTFLVKNRLYFLEVKYKNEKDFNADIEGFLDKFTLLKTADNPNPEIIGERPVKKFEITYPGKPTVKENFMYHALFGNQCTVTETYEIPQNQIDLPKTKNIAFAVNYVKFSADNMKNLTTAQLKEFITTNFISYADAHSNGKILLQKEISLNGNWGIEGQVPVFNGKVVMHTRTYLVGDNYYQLIVMSKKGKENNKEALNFLNSFKLKD